MWFRPLGLIKRANVLIECSKVVLENYNGFLPSKINQLLNLPGLGQYSARAVACLAFDAAVPMIDESSGRLLRRVFGFPSNKPAYSDKELLKIAADLLPNNSPREFNLGLLDIAAAYCHVRNPDCSKCPLSFFCKMFSSNLQKDR